MLESVLRPGDIGPEDRDRVLSHLNGAADTETLALTLGLSEGLDASRRVAAELLGARRAFGRFATLNQVLAVTGVTLARFTEIVMALSGAQAPIGSVQVRFLAASPDVWLGQAAQLTVQISDAKGQAVLDRRVTVTASEGLLSSRIGVQVQQGSALSLQPEIGGLVRLSFDPDLSPPLSAAAKAALGAQLGNLDPTANSPQDDIKGLQQLASRYRGQASGALQKAIDQLFKAAPPPTQPASSPWPVQSVTLLAMVHGEDGQITQTAAFTLNIRNWLGGFYAALRDELRAHSPLRDALSVLKVDAEAGLDLSAKLIQATQSFSALERGVIGRELRVAGTGETLNGFLTENAATLKGDAVVNTVRAVGASESAIASGGFAVFEAIRTVQDASDVIAPESGLRFEGLDGLTLRVDVLEQNSLTRTDLNDFEASFTQQIDVRLDEFAQTTVTTADLDQLRLDLTADLDTRIKAVEGSRVSNDTFNAFDTTIRRDMDARIATRISRDEFQGLSDDVTKRLDTVEENSVTSARLDEQLRGFVSRSDFDAAIQRVRRETAQRLTQLETNALTTDSFERLRTELRAEIDERLRGTISRDEVSAMLKEVQGDLDSRLAKIEETTVTNDRLVRSNAEVLSTVDSQVATRVSRTDFDAGIEALKTDVSNRLRSKANARTVADLRVSLDKVNELQTKLEADVKVIDRKISTRGGGGGGGGRIG